MIATSMFSHTAPSVQAGDPAPPLTWTKIVASTSESQGPQNLLGQTTVLLFLPPVSHNEQAVSIWNQLVDQFAGEPVNFVWIASEPEESLALFLKTNPVRGWMILDPQKKTYRAYGVGAAAGVLIEPRGTIAGFTFMSPNAQQIHAVLDGNAIAVKGEPTEEQMDALFEGRAVRLEAVPFRMPPPPRQPDLPPPGEVRIAPSQSDGTASSSGPGHWMQRGFDLRAILVKILTTSPARIELPVALDDGTRYDVVLVPAPEEGNEAIHRRVRDAVEAKFHVVIESELRTAEVYVMTALAGKVPPRKPRKERSGGSFTSSRAFTFTPMSSLAEGMPPARKDIEEATRRAMQSAEFRESLAMAELTAMTALSASTEELARALEDGLHRPVLDETGLTGLYDFRVEGGPGTREEFLGLLRDQLGLVLTPTQRSVEKIVVRPVE